MPWLLEMREAGAGRVWLNQLGEDQCIFHPKLSVWGELCSTRAASPHHAKLWLMSCRCCAGEEVGFSLLIPHVFPCPFSPGAPRVWAGGRSVSTEGTVSPSSFLLGSNLCAL